MLNMATNVRIMTNLLISQCRLQVTIKKNFLLQDNIMKDYEVVQCIDNLNQMFRGSKESIPELFQLVVYKRVVSKGVSKFGTELQLLCPQLLKKFEHWMHNSMDGISV